MMKVKILSLALLTNVLFSTSAFAFPPGFAPKPINIGEGIAPTAKKTSHIMGCSAGNFYGEMKYERYEDAHEVVYHLGNYRIKKYNGQKGGNKANINTTAFWVEGTRMKNTTKKSKDNRKQNGEWNYNYEMLPTTKGTRRELQMQFIFDKSGSDPRCTAVAYH